MLTKDLKKGTRVQLRNGWKATIKGSARGTTTLCEVYGLYTELGSVYTHDIVARQDIDLPSLWHWDIELTDSQIKCKMFVKAISQ